MKAKNINYRFILGIDIGGATRNGLALYDNKDKKLLYYKSISRRDAKTNLEHRNNVIFAIQDIMNKYTVDIIIFEAIRLFSCGRIQMQTILSLCKIQTSIINEFSDKCDIYQVDVRAWKSRVLGSANADKLASITLVSNKYPNVELIDSFEKPRKHEICLELNADLSDAICISECLKIDYSILQDKNKLNYK